MASRVTSMTTMASIIRLLRLRIIVIVGVWRPHVVAHIVAPWTPSGTLRSRPRVFLAPRALDRGPADVGPVDGHDGRAGGLFVVVPDEGVAFVPEVPDFEDPAVRAKGGANGVFVGVCNSTTIHCKVHA